MEIEKMNMEKVKELAQLEIEICKLEDTLEDTKAELKQRQKARKETVMELIRIGSGQLQIDDYAKDGKIEELGRDALQEIIQIHVDENEAHLGILNEVLKEKGLAGPEDLTCVMAREIIAAMDIKLPDTVIKELCEGDTYSCSHCADDVEGPSSYYLNVPQNNDEKKYCCKAEAQAAGYPENYEEREMAEENEETVNKVVEALKTEAVKGDPFKLTLASASLEDLRTALESVYDTPGNKGRGEALIAHATIKGWTKPHEECPSGILIKSNDDMWTCIVCGSPVEITETEEAESDAEDSQG